MLSFGSFFLCRYKAVGIRLDSGDLAYLSCEARKIFCTIENEFGVSNFGKMSITASNDLNEETLDALNKQVIIWTEVALKQLCFIFVSEVLWCVPQSTQTKNSKLFQYLNFFLGIVLFLFALFFLPYVMFMHTILKTFSWDCVVSKFKNVVPLKLPKFSLSFLFFFPY